jgi:hypothetical protein
MEVIENTNKIQAPHERSRPQQVFADAGFLCHISQPSLNLGRVLVNSSNFKILYA